MAVIWDPNMPGNPMYEDEQYEDEQNERRRAQRNNQYQDQDQQAYEDQQAQNAQSLYQALSAQQYGVSQRWRKAMSDLQKARQDEFNERMQWEHLDEYHLDKLADGTTDWLSDAFRDKLAEQNRIKWDPKDHIDPDSKPYRVGFYLGMALGNSAARKQIMDRVLSPHKQAVYHQKAEEAKKKVDEIEKKMPGISVDASYAAETAPDEEQAKAYANASQQERLNGHMPLTPETAAMEYMMAEKSAFDAMKKPGSNKNKIQTNLSKFEDAISQKAERDHMPSELITQEREAQFIENVARDPKYRFLYKETMDGFDVKNGRIVSKNTANLTSDIRGIDHFTVRKPEKLSTYMSQSFKDFRQSRRDLHITGSNHQKIISDYRKNMFHQADLASFDNDVGVKTVTDAMQAGTLSSTMTTSMHYYEKKYGKDIGDKLAKQTFEFAKKTVAYGYDDVLGAAKELAKDNKLKGVPIKEQVNSLMYAHQYAQDSATLTGLDPNTIDGFYDLEMQDLLKDDKYVVDTKALKYFDKDNLHKLALDFDESRLYKSGDFVDEPMESPSKVLKKALDETKSQGGDTRELEQALSEVQNLGKTPHDLNKKIKDTKTKTEEKAREVKLNTENDQSKKPVKKTGKPKNIKQAVKDKPAQKHTKVFLPGGGKVVDNSSALEQGYKPVLDENTGKGKHKELLPSLDKLNPKLAENIEKQKDDKDDELVH